MSVFWEEITEGWEVTEDRDGNSATRVYFDQSSTSGALPAFNSSHPTEPTLFVAHIRKVKINRDSRKQMATLTYLPKTANLNDQTVPFNDLDRNMQIGAEALAIDGKNSYVWLTDLQAVNQDVFKRIITGTYTVQEAVDGLGIGTGGAKDKIVLHAGKINQGTFQGESSGTWLYLGAGFDERRDETGDKFWIVEHAFSFRKIPNSAVTFDAAIGGGVNTSEWGWRKVWRDDAGAWDVANVSVGAAATGYLYEFVNFSNIFSTSGVS
jgi:glutaredoxin-related protein